MWSANDDNDVAFERRVNPVLKEIGDRCKVVTAEGRQQLHEPTPAPSRSSTQAAAQAQALAPATGAHGSTSSSLRIQERENEALQGPAVTTTHRTPSAAGSMASGSFAEVATFFREERAHFEAKMEAQRKELEAKLEAQRQETEAQRKGFEIQRKELEEKLEERLEAKLDAQRKEFEIKLETQRQEIEQKDAMTSVSDAQLERLQGRLDALHQAKLLTDDEMTALEDKVADFIDCRASVMVAPRDIGAASEIVRKLVGMCEGVSKDGMLARELRNRYL